jgi:hypothetical protein
MQGQFHRVAMTIERDRSWVSNWQGDCTQQVLNKCLLDQNEEEKAFQTICVYSSSKLGSGCVVWGGLLSVMVQRGRLGYNTSPSDNLGVVRDRCDRPVRGLCLTPQCLWRILEPEIM